MHKPIYKFSKAKCDWLEDTTIQDATGKLAKKILGGKGAGLVTMVASGLNVPPGFTITTEVCNEFYTTLHPAVFTKELMAEVADTVDWLSDAFGYTPMVSVRSGAPVSMPGMMDTILNVGLCTSTIPMWEARIGTRPTWDSYRRLIQMLGTTAYGIPAKVFDDALQQAKADSGVKLDSELTGPTLSLLVNRYKQLFKAAVQKEFPDTLSEQIEAAILAVFNSWKNPRAIEYRKINKIPEDMGTAVTVQSMVFGNMGEDSGTGVLFTRDPSTGENIIMGEFLTNAQGEDVVAGIRTPQPFSKMYATEPTAVWSKVRDDLTDISIALEKSYADMVDIEFTVQQGELFILQSRSGKRSASAAIRIAVELAAENVISTADIFKRITREQFKLAGRPNVHPSFDVVPNVVGLPACPGVVTGVPVFSAEEAVKSAVPCILVTHETNPNDIAGMAAAVGILTQTGGATSHAAVVARAMDKPCVVGCTDLDLKALQNAPSGSTLTIDGSTGKVWLNVVVPLVDSSGSPEMTFLLETALKLQNAHEPQPVDLPDHKVISASFWWGQVAAMEAVIHSLAQRDCSDLILDLRQPTVMTGDMTDLYSLAFAFSPAPPPSQTFERQLLKTLGIYKTKLVGLTLLHNCNATMLSIDSEFQQVMDDNIPQKIMPAAAAVYAMLAS